PVHAEDLAETVLIGDRYDIHAKSVTEPVGSAPDHLCDSRMPNRLDNSSNRTSTLATSVTRTLRTARPCWSRNSNTLVSLVRTATTAAMLWAGTACPSTVRVEASTVTRRQSAPSPAVARWRSPVRTASLIRERMVAKKSLSVTSSRWRCPRQDRLVVGSAARLVV